MCLKVHWKELRRLFQKQNVKKSPFRVAGITGYFFILSIILSKEILKKQVISQLKHEKVWFLTETAMSLTIIIAKSTLVCKLERDTVNVPHKKQKTNFHAIYINNSLIN
jgi:hypothetical protein